MSALHVEALAFAYPRQQPVLRGLSFSLEEGEVFALLGANGAGKSTLLACILGFLQPQQGRILVGGVDALAEPQKAREKLAYVPEAVALWGFLTAVEHVQLFNRLLAVQRQPEEVLAEVGLPAESWRRPVAGYSKGMRQKLALALACLRKPQVALFDEPTSGLDPESAATMVGLLRRRAQEGVGVLVVTHDLWLVRQVADRFAFLRGGTLLAGGSGEELRFLPGQSLREAQG
jgi:ABC-2 type transport system ATP-binding protein